MTEYSHLTGKYEGNLFVCFKGYKLFFHNSTDFYGSVEVSSVSYSSRSFILCQKHVFWTHKAQWNQETSNCCLSNQSLIFLLSNSQAFNT